MTALDTGFFLRLLEGHEEAKAKWQALVEGEEGLVSGLTLVELLRLGLKGALAREDAELLLKAIPAVCRVVWPDWGIGERAARLSHGLHLPLVDALILATALEAGAGEIWTADADLARYEGKLRVVLLRPEG
ncbi:type II toxin-antitoxin system VapC family toxin [Thermus antranikianii]|uniref:type II toxin-antitoxin system VapC family toxin n=1 Tax=Thermus antranikianii TaxID=88190 RepID=UPI001C741109|nr:type II toxin-antitoxin system VapC family toxin [Thermus antranikianii]QWK21006.1 MAG: type II toxin-antitoxin system VapC family toxin [Thermus antranikianii]